MEKCGMTGIYGQDWASYQPAQPSTSGLSFAFVKVTEGMTYTNPEWTSQRDTARAAGLVVGYYHYPNMNNSAQTEADHFLATAQPAAGEMLCLDWEGYDATNAKVSHAQQVAYKETFLRHLKVSAPGLPVGMYCSTDYWTNVDTTGFYQDYLWIATGGLPAGQPGITANWLFHQYGSPGGVDWDYCHLGSTAELRSWALSFQPAPTPAPAPPPEDIVTPQDIDAIAAAVWNYLVPDWGIDSTGKPVALGTSKAAYWHQVWNDVYAGQQQQLMQQILAAAQAAKLSPAELTQALADGTLKVTVTVAPAAAPTGS